ncbi:DUF5658 family protein [Alkalihalobacillus sp. BA299]|uniref:DUF5658 family protein n=1 Tax=Alkalihalobacillus sp. BA299 TaxID=2815938 RepID=UPI0035AC0E18
MCLPVVNHIIQHRTPYLLTCCLLLLSIADAIFTDIGLRQAVISEMNPIINSIYDKSVILFYLIKIALPISLIICVPYVISSGIVKQILAFAVIIYFCVFIYHIGWSTYVIYSYFLFYPLAGTYPSL